MVSENDRRYMNRLSSKQKVCREMGKTLTELSKKLEEKQPIYSISNSVRFENRDSCSFNMGTMGVTNSDCEKAYKNYIDILLKTVINEYKENSLKLKVMGTKI